jgi:hypothetical protein
VFTTDDIAKTLEQIRGEKPIHIVPIPFKDLYMWKMYEQSWKTHHAMDKEQMYHSPELYCIWAQKSVFVEEAIQRNPFGTNYFYWCDIGAFRSIPTKEMCALFPIASRFPNHKILLSSVSSATTEDYECRGGIHGDFFHKDRIVGGLWGGSAEACTRWRYAYEAMLIRYFANKRFAGKDQSVMLSTYLDNPELAEIVAPTKHDIDIWFFAHHLLSDSTVPYEVDPSYTKHKNEKPIVSVSIMGGLGNQMFQIASAYSYAKQQGATLQLLRKKKEEDGRNMYWDSTLFRFHHCLVDRLPGTLPTWSEIHSTQYNRLPPLQPAGLYMNGYFQSSKYFVDDATKQEIKQCMKPQPTLLLRLQQTYNFLFQQKENVVVIHARRTDYLKSQWNIDFHGPLSVDYYKDAIQEIGKYVENPTFVLCSDDPQYWFETIPKIHQLQEHPIHILVEDEISTMALLQQFSYFVIANSSFSWWSAWLSDAKKVICPKQWFGPRGPSNYEDIYESDWKRI